jgi:excinuclease ABC subunit A
MLRVIGATANNLKKVTAEFPLGLMTCVTGVSGSGKSTLINDTLFRAVATQLNHASPGTAHFDRIEGLDFIDRVIEIDQTPIGRTPRSNPATYTGLFAPIREIFATVPESRARGYEAGRFSFNVKGGRCEACQGDGVIKVEMHFLADVYVPCDVCRGKRYNRETLEIRFKGKNIQEILDLTVFLRGTHRAPETADAARRRALLCSARAERDHALGRRGAARQARQGTLETGHRTYPVHSR